MQLQCMAGYSWTYCWHNSGATGGRPTELQGTNTTTTEATVSSHRAGPQGCPHQLARYMVLRGLSVSLFASFASCVSVNIMDVPCKHTVNAPAGVIGTLCLMV